MNDTSTRTIDDLLADTLEARTNLAAKAIALTDATAAHKLEIEHEKTCSRAYFAASDALRKPKRPRKSTATTGVTP